MYAHTVAPFHERRLWQQYPIVRLQLKAKHAAGTVRCDDHLASDNLPTNSQSPKCPTAWWSWIRIDPCHYIYGEAAPTRRTIGGGNRAGHVCLSADGSAFAINM